MSEASPGPRRHRFASQSTADDILAQLEVFGIRLGLDTTRRVLAALGRPETRFAAVLVAGTNGKGSTAALLASMCSAAGYCTGLFTSPHLVAVTERAQVDGASIPEEELAELLTEVVEEARSAVDEPPTYFEALFVASCLWFARRDVDLVIFEVGMGGRLDATNACEPLVSVVTRIGLEHEAHLGSTEEQIAAEKAGVFRAGRVAVIGEPESAAAATLGRLAETIGARPVIASETARVVEHREDETWRQQVVVASGGRRYEVELGLAGHFQRQNLLTAIVAAEALAAAGLARLTRRAIEAGPATCRWPGRLERLVLAGGQTVVLDSAHNPQAAAALSEYLAPRLDPCTLVFAVLEDKDAEAMLACLQPLAAAVVLTAVASERGRDPLELLAWVARPATVTASTATALELARSRQRPILVTGSLYLVGEARGLLAGSLPSATETAVQE